MEGTELQSILVSDTLFDMKYIIYQAITRLWGKGRLADWDDASLAYLRSLGVDYVWFTGIPRHATGKDFVKGNPGSPYSISDWMDVNHYFSENPAERMNDFNALVERTHKAGLKMMIDFIPNHVAKDYQGKLRQLGWHDGDWTDTIKNDWSYPGMHDDMLEILRFWASKGVDGFRCDMVELVPSDKLGRLFSAIRSEFPDLLLVAEVYGKENYRRYMDEAGFDLLYDKSGLYDTLFSICKHHTTARAITWNWQWLGPLQPRMLNLLENHDELRLASSSFLGAPEKAYAALAVSLLFNDASYMLYFGQEVGENARESDNGRTSIFNWSCPSGVGHLYCDIHLGIGLDEREKSVLQRYRDWIAYARQPIFSSGKCWDLCYCNGDSEGFDPDRHFAFMRYDDNDWRVVACNFSDEAARMKIAIPPELAGVCRRDSLEAEIPAWDAVILSDHD